MKKLLALLLLVPNLAFGQGYQVPYPAGTPRAFPTPGTPMERANVTVYGDQRMTLVDGSGAGASAVAIEDTVAGSGFAGIPPLGVANETATVLSANGDFTPISTNTQGAVIGNIDRTFQISAANGLLKAEDSVAASGDALVGVAAKRLDQLATGETGSNAEYAVPLVDTLSRLYINPWGAAVTEFWNTCTGTINSATNTSVKASVASNRIYVTSFSCTAFDTTPNQIYVTDGSAGTALDIMQTVSNVVGIGPSRTYPIPLRLTSATALFVTTGTAGSVRCCASGFISVY
jgi:hypothetical protein